jgi:predicted nucleotidyltransferase
MPTLNVSLPTPLPTPFQKAFDQSVDFLKKHLGENLYSLILYGSAARGDLSARTSDLNLLIVLEASTANAHEVISEIVGGRIPIDPMIIARDAMERAKHVFALKFLSIRRNYRVIHGADPLAELKISPELMALLSEQELRNQRMRLTHTYVMTKRKPKHYIHYLMHNTSRFFIILSDTLRSAEVDIPPDMGDRLSVFRKYFQVDVGVLEDLLQAKRRDMGIKPAQIHDLHARLIAVFHEATLWTEKRWPTLSI